jgi:hypothetical protein
VDFLDHQFVEVVEHVGEVVGLGAAARSGTLSRIGSSPR